MFRTHPSICQCAVSTCQVVLFWLLVSRYGYNSLKYCWFCDEKLMLSCCDARDTHFSAFIIVGVDWCGLFASIKVLVKNL